MKLTTNWFTKLQYYHFTLHIIIRYSILIILNSRYLHNQSKTKDFSLVFGVFLKCNILCK